MSWKVTLVGMFFISSVVLAATAATTKSSHASVVGTYACWGFNVGGRGGKCTSPALVLNKNGRYQMGSEKGVFQLKGSQVILSKSKFRGPGTLSDDGLQIRFQYKYRGLDQVVTYLKRGGSAPKPAGSKSSGPVFLDLTIKFAEPYSAIDSISAIELVAQDGSDKTVYEALAYATDDQTLKAYYKPGRGGVPGGKIYEVRAGTKKIGEVDLRDAKGEVSKTIEGKQIVY